MENLKTILALLGGWGLVLGVVLSCVLGHLAGRNLAKDVYDAVDIDREIP